VLPLRAGLAGDEVGGAGGELELGGFPGAGFSAAEAHAGGGEQRDGGDDPEGGGVAMPADAGAGRILGDQSFAEGFGVD